MKYTKRLGLPFLVILAFLGFSCYGAERDYSISKVNYADKTTKISYPQVTHWSDTNKQKSINGILKKEALKIANYYQGEKDADLEINYTIQYQTGEFLSITYTGVGYVKSAAYPNNLFFTTTVDMKTGKRLRLSDLVTINENLVAKFKAGEYKPYVAQADPELKTALQNELKNFGTDDLLKRFANSDLIDDSDTYSYLTKDALIISVNVIHALDDHAEFAIKYRQLAKNIKPAYKSLI